MVLLTTMTVIKKGKERRPRQLDGIDLYCPKCKTTFRYRGYAERGTHYVCDTKVKVPDKNNDSNNKK